MRTHGRISTYRTGCRCEPCREACNAARRGTRHGKSVSRVPDEFDPGWWRDEAACAGMDAAIFFPVGSSHHQADPAKAVCATCPVRSECLAYALDTGQQDGVWGGLSVSERQRLRRYAS